MNGGAPDDRERTIRSLLPLVRHIARRLKRMVPTLSLDDLVGDGSVGLIRAVDTFDAARGTTIDRYARHLIAGAMLNGVRRMDPVSERSRRIVRDGEARRFAIAAERGELPSAGELERDCPGFRRALSATVWGQPLSLDAPLPEGERVRLDWEGDPAAIAGARSASASLIALVDALPGRQRELVLRHYFGNQSLRTIGRALTISPQRASQLHLAALERLRRHGGALAPD